MLNSATRKMTVCPIIIPLYGIGFSIPQLSDITGISKSTVRLNLKKSCGVRSRADGIRSAAKQGRMGVHLIGKKRPMSPETREKISKARKGKGKGYSKKESGYLVATTGKDKHRGLHISIMEEHIGRKLLKHEVVHHKNEIKTDNRIENLELMTRSNHSSLHAKLNQKRGVSYDISKESKRGEDHLKSKLTEEQVIEIFNSKESGPVLGNRYGVLRSTINAIKRGESWKHLNLKKIIC